jgi:type I restriction enzyme S subunit
MNKYQSYKSSGVEWVGEIPEKWRISKFKYVSKLYTGNSLNDEQKVLYESDDEYHIPYVSSKDIDLNTRSVNYNNGLRIPKENNPLKVSPKDSFLLCVEGGSSGRKMVYLDREVCFVNKLCSFKSVENTRFQYYFIQSSNFQDKFRLSLSGLIGGVSISTLRDFELVLPSIQEQHQIVQFLDEKTELIDKLISTKERKITLLKEQRTSLINEVVTKGLNTNVKMKDSGVEWIGEIPEHWMRTKIVRFCKVKDGTHDTPDYIDNIENSIPLVTSNSFVNGLIDFTKCKRISREDYIEINKRSDVTKGDIIMSMIGSNIGNKVLVNSDEEFSIKNVCLFKTSNSINLIPKYLLFLLESRFLEIQVDHSQKGGGQPFLSLDDLRNLIFPIPSVNEQNQIIEHLDLKTKEMDDLIHLEQKKIDLLKEYRQSLISEVVTGKIKVTTDE